MKRCKTQLGYFVLKECGAVAVAQCNSCKGYFCIKHLHGELEAIKGLEPDKETGIVKTKPEEREILCVECFAKRQKAKEVATSTTNYDDWLWYFVMRDSFYSQSHFRPFSHQDSSRMKEKNEEFTDETSDGGFLDS
ncbi:hypothetical protein [Raineya orbicola]|uniref:Uncharacterized protein n=1 Tax=Raineya orbicola TaxID=2016530 RepID=A0A2N3I2U3_9BACT|nr:hypothetical protein [Raineya orbicola]PKQ64627.1 hypothetical protein Rain11_2596 [Raineya orbicola]